MPAEEPKVRNLFLNQRVSPIAPLISRAEWMACAGDGRVQDREEVYLGLDLSSVNDLTALVMVTVAEPVPRVSRSSGSRASTLTEQSRRDFGAGSHRYREWADAGHLLLVARQERSTRRSSPRSSPSLTSATGSGAWPTTAGASNDILREFDRIGLQAYEDDEKRGDGLRLVPWGQGYKDMGPAIDALELAVFERQLVHPDNPVLNWNMANAVATMDPAGNRKLDKDKARFRIDGAVALAMAMGLRARDRTAHSRSMFLP